MKRIAFSGIGLVLSLGLLGLPAGAQNQAQSNSQSSSPGSSLGDYARQVRKDPGVKAKPRVYDNDNLPREEHLSIIGQQPAATADNASEGKTGESTSGAPAAGDNKVASDGKASTEAKGTEEKAQPKSESKSAEEDPAAKAAAMKQWEDKLTAQKADIDLLSRELDVLQREYQIRAAAMYADAGNRMRNSGDWDKQDAQYKQQIADKQKALDDAKQKLDDMQEGARKAGVPASAREQ